MNATLLYNESRLYSDARPYVTGLVYSRLSFLNPDQREDIIQETLIRAHQVLERQGKRFRTSLEEIRKTATGCLRHVLCEAARGSTKDKDAIAKATLSFQEELRENTHDTTCGQVLQMLEPELSSVEEARRLLIHTRTEWALFAHQRGSSSEIVDDFWETQIERKSFKNWIEAQMPEASPKEQYDAWQRRKKRVDRLINNHAADISQFFKARGIHWESLKSLGTRREVSGDSAFWGRFICCPLMRSIRHVFYARSIK